MYRRLTPIFIGAVPSETSTGCENSRAKFVLVAPREARDGDGGDTTLARSRARTIHCPFRIAPVPHGYCLLTREPCIFIETPPIAKVPLFEYSKRRDVHCGAAEWKPQCGSCVARARVLRLTTRPVFKSPPKIEPGHPDSNPLPHPVGGEGGRDACKQVRRVTFETPGLLLASSLPPAIGLPLGPELLAAECPIDRPDRSSESRARMIIELGIVVRFGFGLTRQ